MSRLYSTTTTPTPAPLPDARKLANKQRRQAGRERHEERKTKLKDLEWDRRWKRSERNSQRQEKRPDDGTRTFAGRNLDNIRAASTAAISTSVPEGCDVCREEEELQHPHQPQQVVVPHATSGAMLLAMARPAKVHRGRHRRRHDLPIHDVTDGEMFEVVEIDGRFVALDEDGWEILPDENAQASLLYSDIVRGDVR